MRVFVTGGSGFVGGHLIERLARDGHTVDALARSEASAQVVRGFGARAVRGDLDAIEPSALSGAEAVVHCAARVEDWGPRAAFWAANVEGTRRLLAAARGAAVPRFVHVSTESVVFVGDDLLGVDESAPYPTRHRFLYSETKAEAERLVLAAHGPDLHTVAIRPRLVWGPRDQAIRGNLLQIVADGGFWWIDHGRAITSTVHVDNVVEGLVLALTGGRGGRPYFVTDGRDRPVREVVSALVRGTGVTLPDRSLPRRVALPLAGAVEAAYATFRPNRRPPMSRLAVAMLAATVTVRDDAARAELGYRPVTSIEDGVEGLARAAAATRPAV